MIFLKRFIILEPAHILDNERMSGLFKLKVTSWKEQLKTLLKILHFKAIRRKLIDSAITVSILQ